MRWHGLVFAGVFLASTFCGSPPARAADWYHWIGAGTGGNTATDPADPTTQWNNPANWQEGQLPNASDNALLILGNAGTVNLQTASVSRLNIDGPGFDSVVAVREAVDFSVASRVTVGLDGQSGVDQTSGTLQTYALVLGCNAGSSGRYTLTVGTLKVVGETDIGYYGSGAFLQTGGTNTAAWAYLGLKPGADGSYNLVDGTLQPSMLYVGFAGKGTFSQTGGTNGPMAHLAIGLASKSEGYYTLSDGVLDVQQIETVGMAGSGAFTQTGGVHMAPRLIIGDATGASGLFVLAAGSLTVHSDECIGNSAGTGVFTQEGGAHTVTGDIDIGKSWLASGTLNVGPGSLRAINLRVAPQGSGGFNITSPQARVELTGSLEFGAKAAFTAVDGAEIRLLGSAFTNASADEAALAGLERLRLIFEGGADHWATFEVAGRDLGPLAGAFADNFALGALVLGGENLASVRLEDIVDNGNRALAEGLPLAEALYVHDIVVGEGCNLDLNGLNVYYDGLFVSEGTIVGGSPALVPQPAPLGLVGMGLAFLALLRLRTGGIVCHEPRASARREPH